MIYNQGLNLGLNRTLKGYVRDITPLNSSYKNILNKTSKGYNGRN
jgi:hypothetical protein